MMKWEEYKIEFSHDGSLRDIYILDAEMSDWQHFIEFLKAGHYPVRFSLNGEQIDLPEKSAVIFQKRDVIIPLLTIDVDGLTVNCHFFQDNEIEMDIDPREVTSELKAHILFEFMQKIAEAIGKPIRITPENLSNKVIFEYEPRTGVFRYQKDPLAQ